MRIAILLKDSKTYKVGHMGRDNDVMVVQCWDGEVTYKERALWDAHGNLIERGKGDVTIKFGIEEWGS